MKDFKNKWLIALAALIMMAVTWLDHDASAFDNLTGEHLLPVLIIAGVIFLIKTGIVSAVLIVIRKLWMRLRKNK